MSQTGRRPTLVGLRITDWPERWQALGFTVAGGILRLGAVTVELGHIESDPGTIAAWRLRGIEPVESIDGLATALADPGPGEPPCHANGALSIDHLVIMTPDFPRTSAGLAEAGLELRRVRQAPGGIRQGFRRLGQTILELVEDRAAEDPSAPARFWGLVVVVGDLEALASRLGGHLGPSRPAVQPGRRIATLRPSAGLGPAVAFMTPEPDG